MANPCRRRRRAYDTATLESYWYDGYGRRVVASAPGGTIQSIYGQGGQLLYQDNGRTGKQTKYFYLAGSLVNEVDHDVASGANANRFQHTDALGSPVAETNGARAVLGRSEYEPYGQVLAGGAADRPGYTGHVADAQTGLDYMQQRYYDPMIGRFLSTDPVTALSNPVGMFNRYDYAADNPYRFTDLDGRWPRNPGSRCNNPVFCKAIIPFRQVEPDSCPVCTNSGADRSAKSSNGPSAVDSTQSRHMTTGKPQESRLSKETEGLIALGGGLRYTRDLKTKKDAAGIVVLGVGAKGAFGKGAVGPVREASGQLSYRLWRIAEWNGGQDAPVDIDLGVSAGPLGAELQFDPGGSLDLNVQFNPFGEGGYAGLSVMFDDTLVPDE